MKKIILFLSIVIISIAKSQTTQISTLYCGYTATSTTDFIWADSLGTPSVTNNDRYIFKLQNGVTTFTWQTTNQWPILQWYFILGFAYNTTYTASVAWSNNNGITYGAFGPTCTIISPSIPITQLSVGSCGSNPPLYTTVIVTDPIVLATKYEYRLINTALNYTQTLEKPQPNFNLAQFTGLQNNTTYSVTVRPYLNGSYNPYGPSCNITTPVSPTSSLQPAYCGITATAYNQTIFAVITVGDSTKFKLENTSLGYNQTLKKINFNFYLAQFPGLQNNTTYTVSISVKYNGIWGSYGNPCNITTPTIPTTSIQPSDCGTIATSYTFQLFRCIAISAATHYTYKLENTTLGYVQEFEKINNNFILSQFTGLQHGTTYSVSVKVKFNNNYGPYGNICNISTPSSNVRPVIDNSELLNIEEFNPNLYEYEYFNINMNQVEPINNEFLFFKRKGVDEKLRKKIIN